MELKSLLTKLKKKPEKSEYFFALEIDDDSVKSAVWTVSENQTKVVKLGSSQKWDGTKPENLLPAVDKSISDTVNSQETEPSGAIFGLPKSWIEGDSINSEKKKFLKIVCEQLEIKPLGFVATTTALIKYFRIQEGTPPSAIFLQVDSGELNLVLVKLGKIIGTESVGRSDDLGADVEEGLSRFDKIDNLPARMVLFDGQVDFEEAKQQLVSYDWQERLPFIHFPKVEVLPDDVSIKAVALAGGSEVAKSLGFTIKSPDKKDKSKVETKLSVKKSAASLGFMSNKDIAETSLPEPEPEVEPEQETAEPLPQEIKSEPSQSPPVFKKTFSSFYKFIFNLFSSFKKRLSPIPGKKLPNLLVFIAAGFIILLITLFALFWYLPKATVAIFVEPKTLDENLTLTIDSQIDSIDLENFTLPGESLDISVSGKKTISTTGKALVGDAAKGGIIIYNKTNQSKTFSAGTILIGSDNLVFTLDEDTNVASSSAEDTESDEGEEITIITSGQGQASVTAKSIGPEANFSSGTRFSFKQFSDDDYYAKTPNGLTGGSAREVKAVSDNDKQNLLKNLAQDLKLKAEEQLHQQVGSDRTLVDVQIEDKLISKQFNHDVDEETDNLTLEAKLEYTALSYSQNDFDILLKQAVKEKIPDDFQLSETSETDMEPAEMQKNNTAVIDITFKARLIPKLDFTEIKKNLTGRYPSIIQEYLATLPNFVRADIIIKPNLPKKLKTLPHVSKNIFIEVKSSL